MSFTSFSFALLFVVALGLRLTVGREKTGRPYFLGLLVCSLVFYAWHTPAYLLLLLGVVGVNYFAAGRLSDGQRQGGRTWLVGAVVLSLGCLGFYKYGGFLVRTSNQVLAALGLDSNWGPLEIALPIGISFYTFQALSYTIDVSRGHLQHRKSLPDFLLYVSFFPQLVAGPIVRAQDFYYQWHRKRRLRGMVFSEALFQLISGFFLKLVVADGIAGIINPLWADRSEVYGLLGISALTFLFGMQIFADFAGYSMIARGLGYLLGFRLPINFDAPYIAGSLQEFWRRWHISLSTWLRDYLYVPLGGNRGGRTRTMWNVFLVMVLGGLWHGAGIPFLVWGAIHGLGLVFEKGWGDRLRGDSAGFGKRVAAYLITQGFVFSAWMVFRMESGEQLREMILSLVFGGWGWVSLSALAGAGWFVLPVLGVHCRRALERGGSLGAPSVVEKAIWAGLMLTLIVTAYSRNAEFIYFQF